MKKVSVLFAAALLISAAIPALAEDQPVAVPSQQPSTLQTQQPGGPVSPDQKNECLLYTKNCVQAADSIQTRMRKLDTEVKKGTRVYTPQELKRLQEKLDELNRMLERMEVNP